MLPVSVKGGLWRTAGPVCVSRAWGRGGSGAGTEPPCTPVPVVVVRGFARSGAGALRGSHPDSHGYTTAALRVPEAGPWYIAHGMAELGA